jgi:hypothetical protein
LVIAAPLGRGKYRAIIICCPPDVTGESLPRSAGNTPLARTPHQKFRFDFTRAGTKPPRSPKDECGTPKL